MHPKRFFLSLLLFLAACGAPAISTSASATLIVAATATSKEVLPAASATPVLTVTHTQPPEPSLTATFSPTPMPSETPTPIFTPKPLHGVVNVEKVSCRYGPGAMYLYLYGMVQGATQDLLGRNQTGAWILTTSRGDTKSCWVKADLMNINGDALTLPVIAADDYHLPKSPFYAPLTGVNASRAGDQVTISWNALVLRAGDDSLQTPYILQVWVCRAGQVTLESVGAYQTTATVTDEAGCAQASHGRVAAAEKHGYTAFAEIPWPE